MEGKELAQGHAGIMSQHLDVLLDFQLQQGPIFKLATALNMFSVLFYCFSLFSSYLSYFVK